MWQACNGRPFGSFLFKCKEFYSCSSRQSWEVETHQQQQRILFFGCLYSHSPQSSYGSKCSSNLLTIEGPNSLIRPKCVRFISVGSTGERHPFLNLVKGSRCWLGRCEERAVLYLQSWGSGSKDPGFKSIRAGIRDLSCWERGGLRRRQNLSEKRVSLVPLHRLSLPRKKP